MKVTESPGKFISGIIIMLLSTALQELVKTWINNPQYDQIITFVVLAGALLLYMLVNYLINKRITNGKTVNSIAIKSSDFINKYYRSVRKKAWEGKWEDEEEEIIQTIDSVSHQLLMVGEYQIRRKLGKLVVRNTKDVGLKIRATLDEIGWTSVLMGQKRAIRYFQDALIMTKMELKMKDKKWVLTNSLDDDETKDMAYLAARACRHLASTPFPALKERIEWSEKGLSLIEALESCETLPPYLNSNKLQEMKTGLEYGLGLTHLSYVKKAKILPADEKTVEHLVKAAHFNGVAREKSKDFSNKHRYLKTLLIENEVFRERDRIHFTEKCRIQIPGYSQAQDRLLAMSDPQYNANLKEAETLLKTSIYVDEAFEIYLDERIRGIKEEPQHAES